MASAGGPRDINNDLGGIFPVGYYAVAVVKASNRDITWENLKGKKSCHTAVDRTAGWNIPMGLLYSRTKSCKFGEQSWERNLAL